MSLICRLDNALHNRERTWSPVCNFHDWWIRYDWTMPRWARQ